MNITRPINRHAPKWCPYFFSLTKEVNLFDAFQNNTKRYIDTISSIPLSKENYKYENDKWSIKEVLIHLIDTERYYTYRAFSSSIKVDLELNFEHNRNDYVRNFPSEKHTLKEIQTEFLSVRKVSIELFKNMTEEMLDNRAIHNNVIYSAKSFGWMIVGHSNHHLNIIEERYLI